MSAISDRIQLEISYSGTCDHWGWDIHMIDVKLHEGKSEISAEINREISPSIAQRLEFLIKKKSDSPFENLNKKVCDIICISQAHAKTLKLSARMFQTYESQSMRRLMPDGTIEGELRARRQDISIPVSYPQKTETGKRYRIKVVNDGETVRATFVEVDKKVSEAELRQQKLRTIGTQMLNRGMDRMRRETSGIPQIGGALDGFKQMVEALKKTQEGNPELDALDISELQRRFDAANQELSHARGVFEDVCNRGEKEEIFPALTAKQEASKKVINLEAALNRKKIPT